MINLFINYFNHPNPIRQSEIKECLSKNLKNPNLTIYIIDGRPNYCDFFKKINEITTKNDINIIANADIYFDKTIKLVKNIKENECYALCRWNVLKNRDVVFYNHIDSQDVWIFRGKIKEVHNADFPLGKMGCDNAIADRLSNAGYTMLSPSEQIKTYHLHLSNIHNYSNEERNEQTVVQPPYLILPFIKL